MRDLDLVVTAPSRRTSPANDTAPISTSDDAALDLIPLADSKYNETAHPKDSLEDLATKHKL